MNQIEKQARSLIDGAVLTRDEAKSLAAADVYDLFFWANKLRTRFKGNTIGFCSVVNAKAGICSEDCAFCAQSARYNTNIKTYPLLPQSELEKSLKRALDAGAHCFGVVTSGHGMAEKEIEDIARYVAANKGKKIRLSASLGALREEQFVKLKENGLTRFHHNLETSESFFSRICTTHAYHQRIETIKAAKKAGLEICSGGLFGLGETLEQRLELAFTLQELDVDSVPLNFLNPILGTPLENQQPLPPLEILRTIALFRFVLPKKDISVCGGREVNLRDMQSWLFYAGANGIMVGGYLTTTGRSVTQDLAMIRDLGLEVATYGH